MKLLKRAVFVLTAMILLSAAAFAEEAGSLFACNDGWWRIAIIYCFCLIFVSFWGYILWGDQMRAALFAGEDADELVQFEPGPDLPNPTLPKLREIAKKGRYRFTYLYYLKPDPDKGFVESGEFRVQVIFNRFKSVETQSPRIRIDGVEVRFDHIAVHCAKIARENRTKPEKGKAAKTATPKRTADATA